AGFLLVWHAAAGVVDTAREGRFGFGAWAIVRIVVAVALMAPLPGGLNGAQHAVVGLTHLGGDFANAVWRPFSEEALAESRPIVPRPREALWRAAISRTLIAETCMRAANESAAQAGDDPYVEIDDDEDDGTLTLSYDGEGGGMPDGLCGAIRFTGLEADGAPGVAAEGHRRALTALMPSIRSTAGRLAAHYVPGTPVYGRPLPDIDGLLSGQDLAGSYARALDGALTQAAAEEREALARVVAEDAREASWMAAASFFNTIAHRVGLFQAAAHNVPSVALPVPSLDEWVPAADAAVKGVAAQLARSRDYHPMLLSAANAGAGALPVSGDGDGGMVSGLLEFIDLDSVIVADSGNPIADLAALGHGLLNAALAAVAALMGAATGSGLLESIPFIGKGLDVFESAWQVSDALVSTLLGLLVIAGAVLAYVLPALPFIRFLFGILGWILNVAVAVLAVTVFAAAHVTREDGNRLTVQATRQGWLFLPALVLRPALMLLGLILGYFVFLAAIGLFNQVWLPQMRDAGASGGLGPVGFLAMLALYVIVAYGLMNASFKLIDLLPSAVLDWIGGRAGAGEDGGERAGGTAVAGFSRLSAVRVGARRARGGAAS
ncbi:MAG: DotA/TraY family protein, partial [Rhodospirillales bacterium]|nr:DotA/TraY family protein [Rhodospirillales bacterium]